jgi:hypothetical protein
MASRVISRLDDFSDWLSPIIVKEVRQMIRSREFNYSFGLVLFAGLLVAFFATADALNGDANSGGWTFATLMTALVVIGLGIIPLGTLNALRNERTERTLDLVTLTTLSTRKIVIGKLLAQAVKLLTLFAGLAPFIATGFLLGGIDLVTILVALAALFLWSLWACAACLFLSCLSTSRALAGVVYAFFGLLFLFFLGPLGVLRMFTAPGYYGPSPFAFMFSSAGRTGLPWWPLTIMTVFCLMTMINLVLLAENRLSLPTENRVTALRIGFLAQFLLLAACVLSILFLMPVPPSASDCADALGVIAGLQLSLVAVFTVTEDLILPRRVLLEAKSRKGFEHLMKVFQPGGAAGAIYVLAQIGLLMLFGAVITSDMHELKWMMAICGYICFYTGVPVVLARAALPRFRAAQVRALVLLFMPIVLLLTDLIYYLLAPNSFDFEYSIRHTLNPFRTLANWSVAQKNQWDALALGLGLIGIASYVVLIRMGWRKNSGAADA